MDVISSRTGANDSTSCRANGVEFYPNWRALAPLPFRAHLPHELRPGPVVLEAQLAHKGRRVPRDELEGHLHRCLSLLAKTRQGVRVMEHHRRALKTPKVSMPWYGRRTLS